jgi:hypothetical protein
MHIVGPFVETAVGVAAVVGQLVTQVEYQIFIVACHPQRWIALGVDVVELAAQRLAHRLWRNAFRRDENDAPRLAFLFQLNDLIKIGVNAG